MGLLSNRVDRSEIKAGDHVYTWRAVYAYSHHGIYVGGSKVVHFTRRKESRSEFDSESDLLSNCPIFPDCGFQNPNSGVVLSCLDCFLNDGALHRFEYGVPPAVFLAKVRGGTCTIAESDKPETVIHRAMYLLQNGFGSYDLFEKNCEDFALYCKTGLLPGREPGIGASGQASTAISVPLATLLSTPFQLMAAGPVGMATVTAGMYCAGRYITDIGVRKDVIKVDVVDLAAYLNWDDAEEEESSDELNLHAYRSEQQTAEKIFQEPDRSAAFLAGDEGIGEDETPDKLTLHELCSEQETTGDKSQDVDKGAGFSGGEKEDIEEVGAPDEKYDELNQHTYCSVQETTGSNSHEIEIPDKNYDELEVDTDCIEQETAGNDSQEMDESSASSGGGEGIEKGEIRDDEKKDELNQQKYSSEQEAAVKKAAGAGTISQGESILA